jgi:hypothetical protein
MTPLRITFCSFIVLFTSFASFSQIVFQNNNRESVTVAFARYISTGPDTGWVTKGWSLVTPGNSLKVFNSIGANDSIGYFAITRISETPYPGYRNLLVRLNEPFLIKDADQESVIQNHPEYEWRQFRIIRRDQGKTSGIISFKD